MHDLVGRDRVHGAVVTTVVPYLPEHLGQIDVQDAQVGTFPDTQEYSERLLGAGPCWSLLDAQGIPLACAGLWIPWEGRGVLWAILGRDTPMLDLTRAAQKMFAEIGVRRLEFFVEVSFQQGHRWALMLGFQAEGTMRAFDTIGRDYILYSKVST